ncbi:MAG: pyridoxamine 5'-phosphate oxidase family protein [Caldilineales bacterium]|nr:pyridoxamine 5'-phosphate oxidase family protein [Caldilineales bacterium]MDW8317843.1 pyridoxamine 5'-phosphate oxidase family protein [Anaerolineae bacterium]
MSLLHERLAAFLAAHNTMTLATVGPDGAPQAAAVFYAADEDLNLYFLSSPSSRHSQNLALRPRVAATIQADGQAWQSIQGVQIEGTAHLVEGTRELAHAARVYAARFEFLRGLMEGGGEGPAALRGPLASSRFYVLRPSWVRLIDNTQGFGHKEEWRKEAAGG